MTTDTSYSTAKALTGTIRIGGNTFPARDWLKAQGARWDAGRKTTNTEVHIMSKALARIVRKAQAGDMALALRIARKVSERKAGGWITVLPSEVSAAVLLGAERRGELDTAEAIEARDAMLGIVLRQVAA